LRPAQANSLQDLILKIPNALKEKDGGSKSKIKENTQHKEGLVKWLKW
jgi:hypothetical protein